MRGIHYTKKENSTIGSTFLPYNLKFHIFELVLTYLDMLHIVIGVAKV